MKMRLTGLLLGLAAMSCGTDPAAVSSAPAPPPAKGTDSYSPLYDDTTRRLLAMPAEKPDQFLQNARALGMVIHGDTVVVELELTEGSTADEARRELEQLGIAVRRIMEKYRRATVYVGDRSELEALGTAHHIRRVNATGTRYMR